MHTASAAREENPRRNRPSRLTVFATAFVAGAAVAFGVNRALDVHLAQTRPQVECEPIFVALHSLPQGSPITVWDVALKDWPRAMLPTSALRARDTFEGMVLRHPLREGQPLLSVQLVPATTAKAPAAAPAEQSFTAPAPAAPNTQAASVPEADLWAPSEPAEPAKPTEPKVAPKVAAVPRAQVSSQVSRTDVDFVAPEPQAAAPASEPKLADIPEAATASAHASEDTAPDVAASEAAATDTASVEPRPEAAASPGLLPPSEPLYAPVPASPPADLDGALSGIGDLPAASGTDASEQSTSVLKPTPADAASPAAPQPSQQAAGRYLVVPERIALQADASFAPPAAPPVTPPVASPATSPARSESARTPGQTNTSQTNTRTAKKTPNRPAASAAPATKRQPASSPNGSRQTPPNATRSFGGMFPNLSAGIEAWTGPRKPVAAQPPSTTR